MVIPPQIITAQFEANNYEHFISSSVWYNTWPIMYKHWVLLLINKN